MALGWVRRWRDSREGGVALITALAVPPIALLICGAIDFASVVSDKAAFQNVADATALQAALQVGVSDPTGIAARDDQFARDQLKELADRTTYTVTTQVASDNSYIQVAIRGSRTSFFMNLLPPGGWKLGATAKAAALSQTPLCVLSTGRDNISNIEMHDTSTLTASECLVQSNKDIRADGSAWIKAQMIQSAGLANGNLSPAPQAGGPTIADPFTGLPLGSAPQKPLPGAPPPPPGSGPGPGGKAINLNSPYGICTPVDQVLAETTQTLPPGVHCGNLAVHQGATLTLLPGDHYFIQGNLSLDNNAIITGDDVVLIFDKNSKFSFKDSAQVNLTGRKDGPLAGFVIGTTRANDQTFEISSDSARKLLGTIYIPSAKLLVTGGQDKVADQSAWTVIVAKAIEMHGGPNLVVNANYGGSPVPVPQGVGPANGARLVR